MISTADLTVYFDSRKLFENVNLKFLPGNCYGVIGANGAGKSTLLKVLNGDIEPSRGQVIVDPDLSISTLRQDHFAFNEEVALQVVIYGNKKLLETTQEKDLLYAKADFSEEDGVRAAELEERFAALGGWEAEADAAVLLSGLGLAEEKHNKKLKELKDSEKIKVLLARALFGKPNILLLDEPTNHLDAKSIQWLENFLYDFDNTVIVVSHDRHFLNKVCTHMVDIDYGKAQTYVGNYDFWKESSILARNLRSAENKKNEEKAKELETFIARFSANASKSRQATSRRKQLDKLTLDEMPMSIRKNPHVVFTPARPVGDILLEVQNLTKKIGDQVVLNDLSFEIRKDQKVIFVGDDEIAKTTLFQILMGQMEPDSGSFRWGVTTSRAYLPKDNSQYFSNKDVNLIDWLREFSVDKSEEFIRGFLGRMLFSGEETLKKSHTLSGGEKVRCMLAKMMLVQANVLLFDGPTDHLDLESIVALNNSLIQFPGTVLFVTHDLEFAQTVANRAIEITDSGIIDHPSGLELS